MMESQPITLPPASSPSGSLALDLPPESRRSLTLRREGSRDAAGAGYELAPNLVHVHLEAGARIGAALRMNATCVWFEPDAALQVPYGKAGRVILRTETESFGPFDAKFGIDAFDDDVHAVARFVEVPHAAGHRLVAFMLAAAQRGAAKPVRPLAMVQTDIDDPLRIAVVLKALASRGADAVLKAGDATVSGSLLSFDEARGKLVWSLSAPDEAVHAGGVISAEVAGYNCVYHMDLPVVSRSGLKVVTPCPPRVDYHRYRRYRRAPIGDATVVRFEHPLWHEIPKIDRPLIDVSFGGIAFGADPLNEALYVGLRIPVIEVVTGSAVIHLRGTVRSLVPMPNGTTMCGLSVEPLTSDFAASWAAFVMQALNQTTEPGDDHVDKLWELYTDSGYFSLSGKDPEEFDTLAQSFRSVVERTRKIPWLSYNSVWPSENRIEASVSTLKLYSTTWMLHQLGKRKGTQGDPRARHILRDVYLRAFEYMQTDAKCKWVLSYCEADVRWVQRSHIAFGEHFEPTGAAIARPFRLMEASCHDRMSGPPSGPYRIGAAGHDEQQFILDVLKLQLPQPYLEAADLVPDRIDLASIKRAWEDIGMARAREIWVARQHSVPVAAAILEVGETGTNLFRLTDSLRLVSLQPNGEAAFPALIEKAKAWFLAMGKDSFVYFRDHDDQTHVRATRLRDLGAGRIWVIRSDLIPDFLELVCELTAHTGGPEPGRFEMAVPGGPPSAPVSVRGFSFQKR